MTPRAFADHLKVITESGFATMPMGNLARQLHDGIPLPERTVVISFDDGYVDFLATALPRLAAQGAAATLFQSTGYIDSTFGGAPILSESQLCEVAAAGIEIGSHTVSHPHLDLITEPRVRSELMDSRDRLEQILGSRIDCMAYPHGSHRASVVRQVMNAGYGWATGVKNAYTHSGDNPWAIARITMTARHTPADLAAILNGGVAPMAWRRERLRTTAFREVRRLRATGGYDRAGR